MSEVNVTIGADYVATVEMNRPPYNFIDENFVALIADSLLELDKDTSVRATILCSNGKAFCAGRDFGKSAPNTDSTGLLYRQALRIFSVRKPIVAAVQGAAVGGGLGLALCADFRIATPETRFVANFSRLGNHHGFALTATLPRIVGQQAALNMLFTGRRIGGQESFSLGLCDRLTDIDDLRSEARELAVAIAQSAPLAVLAIRETMRSGLQRDAKNAMARELEQQAALKKTDDFREGVRSVSERRLGDFLGH